MAEPGAGTRLIGEEVWRQGDLIVSQPLAGVLGQALADHNAGQGSADRIERIAILATPPDLDAGEITDKGYVNQRRVLANRAALVDLLYADPAPRGIITPAPIGLTSSGLQLSDSCASRRERPLVYVSIT